MMPITQNADGTVDITAPVMIPGAHDCDYENGETPLSKQQIQRFAEQYKKYQFIDHEHGLTRNGKKIGYPKNSFLLTEDTTMELLDCSLKRYPKGTWFITSRLTDQDAIQTALDGGYTGYSPSVFSRKIADKYLAALKSDKSLQLPSACKGLNSRGTGLIRDVHDPVVLSVSLVKSPCLHDSKICKYGDEIMNDEVKSMKSKILTAMGMTEEAEVEALKSEVASLRGTIDTMKQDFDAALHSMQESFENTLKEALTPVTEESDPLEEDPEETEEVEETTEEETIEDVVEPVAEKGKSKSQPIHDNIIAEKSKPQNIYRFLGRNPDGTRKRG